MSESSYWPSLRLDDWRDTCETLHMWTQIIGKIRMQCTPPVNHAWHVPLYVSSRGLTTSPMFARERSFEIEFDFIEHHLRLTTSDGEFRQIRFEPRSVADFYADVMETLESMDLAMKIWPMPVEVPNPIRFDEDQQHKSYDRDAVEQFFRVLVQMDRLFKTFRGRFIGKCSPVHFFWGSFDLAVTRFSGRRAPLRPGMDKVQAEAYSHEVISHGFWPGGTGPTGAKLNEPVIYAYAAPVPDGLSTAKVKPAQAFYSNDFGEFFLKYEDVRQSNAKDEMVLDFMQSTYDAAADLAKWDRAALEQ
jgi:hypothetical protein